MIRTPAEVDQLLVEVLRLSRGGLSKFEVKRRLGLSRNDLENMLQRRLGTSRWPIPEEVTKMGEIFQDEAGEWRWRLKGKNREIMCTSEGYTREADAIRGFDDAKRVFAIAVLDHRVPGR